MSNIDCYTHFEIFLTVLRYFCIQAGKCGSRFMCKFLFFWFCGGSRVIKLNPRGKKSSLTWDFILDLYGISVLMFFYCFKIIDF